MADYTTWIRGKTFATGDTLVFNYAGGHTVDEVSASDYASCSVGNSTSSDSSGTTSMIMNTPGQHYFICGMVGHCANGMKLTVTVGSDASSIALPPTTPPSIGSVSPPIPPIDNTNTPLAPSSHINPIITTPSTPGLENATPTPPAPPLEKSTTTTPTAQSFDNTHASALSPTLSPFSRSISSSSNIFSSNAILLIGLTVIKLFLS
ncbi:hypothetical protein GIB67_031460 [Kingdonia uniflora]|uniref:Phytocyanin domain-containing protein n=1 Tax=Kingdonia uniflora TaxID=39325 RepID=A0A7J7MBK4_9MAGN|nr:hypothetical protein GIB67_031460 [Kingdonia uniflora]